MLSPDYRVDTELSNYLCRSSFARLSGETKRNYTDDYRIFFNFLWRRGRWWHEAESDDLWDFEDWRMRSSDNPAPVGGARWNRGLAALSRLYGWGVSAGVVARSPVVTREVRGRFGGVVKVPEARAVRARSSNVHWLTPRAFRVWLEVGLRRHSPEGGPESGRAGRLEARNTAFAELLFSSGLRLTEGASLLTFEMPRPALGGDRFYPGRLARAVTKSKRARTFYVAGQVVGSVAGYVESSRAAVVRRAQQASRYEKLMLRRVVTAVTGRRQRVLHWRDAQGRQGRTALAEAGVAERMRLYREGAQGLEPLWLWLNEAGLPLRPASWENVFRSASERCARELAGQLAEPPFCTPHMCRHSFALHMLVVLHHLMDRRMGLSVQERRDFQLLYGDVWRMVQDLLGHAQVETTRDIYLAPVADLRLRSLLADPAPLAKGAAAPSVQWVSELLARIARESEGVQDVDIAPGRW
ncbi:integrase [Streptomyces sp. WAC 04229]|nr:integrase [Streptomyces sp. WAC 04229]